MGQTNSASATRLIAFLLGVAALLATGFSMAAPSGDGDRSLSPYFFVKSKDASVDQLPLKATQTEVNIAGVIADVVVTQTYANNGTTPLEALYVFPASTRAAVYGMKMTIGDRVVVAKIDKREEARRQYEQARQEGKSASLLEQQRPNVFQMNLANIMPGDEIRVEMRYTELLVPEDGVYEFVYPTVVGPRYSNLPESKATPNDRWVANPTLHQGEAPTSSFDIAINIAAGMPIKDAACTSHKTNIEFDGPDAASIRLDPRESHGGNRDFVVRYRLDGDRIQSGLLLDQRDGENFFLLMMQPPKRVAPDLIPGREYIFIVDVSGSMAGFPLDTSKELLRNLIGKLRATDRFNVLLFAGGSAAMAEESVPATAENIGKAIALIEQQQGGGATELLPALKRALSLKAKPGFARSVVIATDGYVTVEEEVFDLMRNNLGQANMFTFGIGTGVNRHLLEGMAHVGMGTPFVISNAGEANAQAERFRKLIESPVLTGIDVSFNGFDAYDVEPIKVPDILSERPLILFGKWRGKPAGSIAIRGTAGDGPFAQNIEVGAHASSDRASALRYLWARHRITLLSDYNKLRQDDRRIAEVTDLGLKYSLLTAYTSFVAVDSQVRNVEGNTATVRQPLPMPEGVSDSAVGGEKLMMPLVSRAAPISIRAPGKVNLSVEVLFGFNETVLSPEGKIKLDELVKKLKDVKLEVIAIAGHADRIEGKAGGGRLAEKRAAVVKDYLVSKGIPAERFYLDNMGTRRPTTGDRCAGLKNAKARACLQPDRRVVVEVAGTVR